MTTVAGLVKMNISENQQVCEIRSVIDIHTVLCIITVALYNISVCLASGEICSLPGCNKPRYVDPSNGRIHDFCSRTHTGQAMSKRVYVCVCMCVWVG